ncbi:MAG: peptide chain release factor N(5)-glutamine methyltransferase [Methylobacterium sp.]
MTSPAFHPNDSRAGALRQAANALEQAGIAEARSDARFLGLHVLELTSTDLALRGHVPIGPDGAAALFDAIRRRIGGEPVARILGEWEFRGLTVALSPGTLVPRPDTETLVDTALRHVTVPSPRILDLGTGSGCILIALLSEWPGAWGIGVDRSEDALVTAKANAVRNGVGDRAGFLRGDWCAAVRGPFDLIVSNPPYIARGVIPTLSEEVRRYDPAAALDGGLDGLDAYRAIVDGLAARPGLLSADGALLFEIGYDQAEAVAGLGDAAGFRVAGIDHDLAGHARVVTLRPPFDVRSNHNKVVR